MLFRSLAKLSKKNKRMPKNASVLNQEIQDLLSVKGIADLVTKDDLVEIKHTVEKLYSEPLLDGEDIREKVLKFSVFVQMKDLNDNFDLSDFNQYDEYSKRIAKLLSRTKERKDQPLYLVKDVVERQFVRQSDQIGRAHV